MTGQGPEPVAWLRRCNGQPEAGILTGRAEAEDIPFLAGTRQLRGSLATGLSWRAAGHDFTLQPLSAEELRAWCDAHGVIPPAAP